MAEKKYKNINVKVDERLVEKVNYYRKLDQNGEMSQADFVIKALDEKCNNERIIRSGGMILKIPNPNFYELTEEERIKIIQTLSKCVNELNSITPYAEMGLIDILSHTQTRLLKDDKKRRNEVREITCNDLNFEEALLNKEK